jgi:uncharacterized protein DUF3592
MKFRSFGSYALSVFLLFISFGYMYVCFQYFKYAQQSINWKTTNGVIVSSEKVCKTDNYSKDVDKNQKYYKYDANSKIYYSDRISFSPFLIQENNNFKLGEKVKVYYNPSNQAISTINTKINIKQFCVAIFFSLVGIFYSICLLGHGIKNDIINNITKKSKTNILRQIYRCITICAVVLLIEIAPIFIAIVFNIDVRKDEDRWFMIVYILVIMWMSLQSLTAFYLFSDILLKYKRTPKKIKANIKMIIGSGAFISLSVISVIVWILWIMA